MRKKAFGKICATLRKEKLNPRKGRVWSQADLAEASNLPCRSIGKLEHGELVNLDRETLEALATAFDLT